MPNPPAREKRRASWISKETWQAIDTRVTLFQENDRNQKHTRFLGRRVWSLLNANRKLWTEATGVVVDSLLASDPPPFVKEAWHRV